LSRAASQSSAAQSFAAIFRLLVVALVVDWIIPAPSNRALRGKAAGQTHG
jgi:hypothetical protein